MTEPRTVLELPGWELCWFHLSVRGGAGTGGPGVPGASDLGARRGRIAAELRSRHTAADLGENPAVAALRRLFKAAGTDPSRYRPSSEALLRRLLKGEELATIHPLVDFNNQVSIELAVPACILRDGSFEFPVTLRSGRAGETLDSMRGPFDLAGKPLLADSRGPFGTPITDSHRVKVLPDTTGGWLVAYLPAGVIGREAVAAKIDVILAEAPVVERD